MQIKIGSKVANNPTYGGSWLFIARVWVLFENPGLAL